MQVSGKHSIKQISRQLLQWFIWHIDLSDGWCQEAERIDDNGTISHQGLIHEESFTRHFKSWSFRNTQAALEESCIQ